VSRFHPDKHTTAMARPRTAPNDDAQFQQPFERMENEGHTASQGQRPRRDSAAQSFDEAEREEGVTVSKRRQLYCGPMSWLMGACFFGPLVLLCPCGASCPLHRTGPRLCDWSC
jgi:hypothetical protein